MAFAFPRFQTPRVNLRLLTAEDADAVYRHFADPEVTAFMDIEPVTRLEEAEEIIRFHVEDTGCRWGLFCRATKILVGTCGYHCWRPAEATAEIGFDLAKAYWGIGLMREVLPPVLEVGFGRMGLTRIEATVETANVRSIRLLEALAFDREPDRREGLEVFVLDAGTHRVGGKP